jgi:hypothetical protein
VSSSQLESKQACTRWRFRIHFCRNGACNGRGPSRTAWNADRHRLTGRGTTHYPVPSRVRRSLLFPTHDRLEAAPDLSPSVRYIHSVIMDSWAVAMLGEGSVGKSALVQQVRVSPVAPDISPVLTFLMQLVMESFVGMLHSHKSPSAPLTSSCALPCPLHRGASAAAVCGVFVSDGVPRRHMTPQ